MSVKTTFKKKRLVKKKLDKVPMGSGPKSIFPNQTLVIKKDYELNKLKEPVLSHDECNFIEQSIRSCFMQCYYSVI